MSENRITQFDTQHDYRPTHSYPPVAVQVARDAMEQAWDMYYGIVDEWENGRMGRDEVQEAGRQAQEAEENYRQTYQSWQRNGGNNA